MILNKKWDLRFLTLAKEVASWSKDKSTKVGCVITHDKYVRSIGFNGLPKNINDDIPERQERPLKYLLTDHAEVNALDTFPYNSAKDCTAYVTHFPCAACTRALIRKDIKRLVTIKSTSSEFDARWKEEHDVALEMLREAGIIIHEYEECQLNEPH